MQSDSIKNKLTIFINGQALSFDPEIDIKTFIIQPESIDMKAIVSNEIDASGISISIGDDIGFKGFSVRLERVGTSDTYKICQEDIDSICGMRLIGRAAVNVFYFDFPLDGYSTFIHFIPRREIEKYVMAMRNDFKEDIAGLIDLYGLTQEEFELESSEEDLWEPSSLHFLLIYQLYKNALPFFDSKTDELDSTLILGSRTSWHALQNVKQIQSHQLYDAYLAGQAFHSVVDMEVKMLPSKVLVRDNEVSYDTYPNRLILGILCKIKKDVKAIYDLYCLEQDNLAAICDGIHNVNSSYMAFVSYKKEKLKQAKMLCENVLRDTHKSICQLIDLGVQMNARKYPTNRLNLKQTYRMVLLGYRRFRSNIQLVKQGVHPWALLHTMQTRGINYLYELWVARYILKLFTDSLNFTHFDTKVNEQALTTRLIIGKTIELKSPQEGTYIKFYYGRKFPRLDNPSCTATIGVIPRAMNGDKKLIAKDNPDICIEFYDNQGTAPRILILDATFSNNPIIHREKSYYKHLIWYRPNSNAPKTKWQRVVVESLAVHPYQSLTDDLPLDGELILVPGLDRRSMDERLIELLQFYRLIEFDKSGKVGQVEKVTGA